MQSTREVLMQSQCFVIGSILSIDGSIERRQGDAAIYAISRLSSRRCMKKKKSLEEIASFPARMTLRLPATVMSAGSEITSTPPSGRRRACL